MHVVVTGGSSGIGLEVARIYAARGASVSIIARDPQRLQAARLQIEQSAPGSLLCATAADVCDADSLAGAIGACEAQLGPCDILVACAGTVDPVLFHEQSDEGFRAQWETNFTGVVNAVRHVYAGMRDRGDGRIMVVSSAAAFLGIPAYTAYCASKSALVGFVDALRLEAQSSGISVGICYPPDTDTPQLAHELRKRPKEADMLMGRIRPRRADKIASLIVGGIDRRKARVYFTVSVAALALFGPSLKPWIELWCRLRARTT